MNILMIAMRLVHIVLGVFWAGTLFFFVTFLEPSLRAAGPGGAPVMQGLIKRGYLNILPTIAGLTILSGLVLYWRLSGGLTPGWITSSYGFSLTLGGVASIVAFTIGVFVMRRAALRIVALAGQAQSGGGAESEQIMEEIQALRVRARVSARWVAALLAVAVAAMAVARYV